MTKLILIRHGESQANRNGIFAGNYDADLEQRGLMQAEKTAYYVKENYKVDKVYASDLIRAYKTGKCIGDILGLDVTKCEGFREIKAGKWDGAKFDYIIETYPEEYAVWKNDIGNSRPTEGESVAEMKERVMNAFEKVAIDNEGKTILIATHATPIRIMQTIVQMGTLEKMTQIPWVSNASVSVYNYEHGQWSAEVISYDEHLSDMMTNLPTNV